jgi:hypothetical protein
MQLNGLIAALQKLVPVVGDAEVVLKDVDAGVVSAIHSLSIDLAPTGEATGATVTVKHAQAPAVPAAPEPAAPEPSADPAAA